MGLWDVFRKKAVVVYEEFDKAIKVAERIEKESGRSWALRNIALELAKIDVDIAIEVIEKIEESWMFIENLPKFKFFISSDETNIK